MAHPILHLIFNDDFHETQIAPEDESEASKMIDALQEILDRGLSTSHNQNTQERRKILKTIRYLNRIYGVLPSSVYLKDLVCESRTAVTGGGFSDVWIGRLHDQRVCIKVLRFFQQGSNRDSLIQALSKEVLLWMQLKHPNILPFLGVNTELFAPSFCIVSPWMSNGDIINYSRDSSLNLSSKLQYMIQIAQGLVYLHGLEPPIVHGDIKGANILVSDDRRCCLADFGLSVLDTQSINPTHTATVQGSLRWLAPEFIRPTPNPQASQGRLTSRDMYAFGCTVFEILTESPPFAHYTLDISVAIDVLKGVRPSLPLDIIPNKFLSDSIRRLLALCWSERISERPDAEDAVRLLSLHMAPESLVNRDLASLHSQHSHTRSTSLSGQSASSYGSTPQSSNSGHFIPTRSNPSANLFHASVVRATKEVKRSFFRRRSKASQQDCFALSVPANTFC
ncbi:kinase-like domain-containing protein [Lentinula raphanica]|nr:kinase-like domain-containing protein [Lentinula raphanica]